MAKEFDGYQNFFPAASPDVKFGTEFKYGLVNSVEDYEAIIRPNMAKIVAWDTETTGLDWDNDEIVGFSVAFSPYEAYYVPLRHKEGKNAPLAVLRMFYEDLIKSQSLLFNMTFDLLMMQQDEYLQKEGVDVFQLRCFEVMALVFNADTNQKKANLKWAAKHFLGRDCPEFEEVLGKKARFNMLTPEEGVYYACCDAANTFGLYRRIYPALKKECPFILKLDSMLAKAMCYYSSNYITIDSAAMKELVVEVTARVRKIEREIFSYFGRPIRLASNRDLSNALLEIGIDTSPGERTKDGNMKLGMKYLQKTKHEVCQLIIEQASLSKQLNSYMKKLSKVDGGHISFMIFHVPTGRFASGNSGGKNPYFLNLNYQNLTKAKPQIYEAFESDERESILGWGFEPVSWDYAKEHHNDPDKYLVEGFSPELNVRRAITVPNKDEWYFVSLDYSAEELMIATNLCMPLDTEIETNLGLWTLEGIINYVENYRGSNHPDIMVKTPIGFQPVTRGSKNVKEECVLHMSDGSKVRCSEDHFFLILLSDDSYEFKRFKDIKEGDLMFEPTDEIDEEKLQAALDRYNLDLSF